MWAVAAERILVRILNPATLRNEPILLFQTRIVGKPKDEWESDGLGAMSD